MIGSFTKHKIERNMEDCLIITIQLHFLNFTKFLLLKEFLILTSSQLAKAFDSYLASTLDQATTFCFLLSQEAIFPLRYLVFWWIFCCIYKLGNTAQIYARQFSNKNNLMFTYNHLFPNENIFIVLLESLVSLYVKRSALEAENYVSIYNQI